ncbi:MAG: DNA-processing protein DprA [Paraperlucidibaca sp.]
MAMDAETAIYVAAYILLEQQAKRYRHWLTLAKSPEHGMALLQRAAASLRLSPQIAAVCQAWPAGREAADAHAQWQHSCRWLAQPNTGVWFDTLADERVQWPQGLMRCSEEDRPPLLFYRGDEALLGLPQVAIVGSRAATARGLRMAATVAKELAQAGIAITSGLASGIDGAAHQGALAAGGKTIAVLGAGIDRVYPPQHQGLADELVAKGGLIVSEFAPGTPAKKYHFPRRNAVIAGLSLGVLVVEAGANSGSISTAKAAGNLARDIWAMPGPIDQLQSRGCHQLIRDNKAVLVEGSAHVLIDVVPRIQQWFGLEVQAPSRALTASTDVRREPSAAAASLRDSLDWTCHSVDDLAQAHPMTMAQLLALLGELEVMGWLEAVCGGYQRVAP